MGEPRRIPHTAKLGEGGMGEEHHATRLLILALMTYVNRDLAVDQASEAIMR